MFVIKSVFGLKFRNVFFLSLLFLIFSCKNKPLPNQEMIDLLRATDKLEDNHENIFCPEAVLKFADSLLNTSPAAVTW
jgi:hypothetical protein